MKTITAKENQQRRDELNATLDAVKEENKIKNTQNQMEKKYTTLEVLQQLADVKMDKLKPRPHFGLKNYQSKSATDHIDKLTAIYNDEAKLMAYFTKL